jgi:acyl-CoA synthetase (NDP forming)/GNAT superfamily N-acetyltransferase
MDKADVRPVEVEAETWECDVLLRDGLAIHVRALRADDREGIVALHERSSEQTHYLRFFTKMPHLNDELLDRLTLLDQRDRVAIVAESSDGICAVGRYDRILGSPVAEVAFVVDDSHQGRGIATILLEHLATIASSHGIETFDALVLAENHAMLGVFRSSGYATSVTSPDPSTRVVSLVLQPTQNALQARQSRDSVAAVASLQRLLQPSSIAIVGASNRVGSPAHQIIINLIGAGFHGSLFPINPSASLICGLQSYARVGDVGAPIDVGVIAVRADAVEEIVEQCGAIGVSSLVIISAGFAEMGVNGKELQDRLAIRARKYGMRFVGPNCLGVANTDPLIAMNATFASMPVPVGSVGVMTQSGAVGLAILDGLSQRGLGVSSFVSVGNKADISGNDLLSYWAQDHQTKQIALYLESFGDSRAFARIAADVAKTKPIVAIKTGRSEPAAAAASSHTAALALPDNAVETLFTQSGVIRVGSVEQLVDFCTALDTQPLPAGPRIAIVTNAGGPAILATDTIAECGLEIAGFSPETISSLDHILGRSVGTGPLDLRADTTPQRVTEVLKAVIADPNTDSVLAILADVSGSGIASYIASVEAIASSGKPVLCNFIPNPKVPASHLAVFPSAERAIQTLAHLVDRSRWLHEIESETFSATLNLSEEQLVRRHIDRELVRSPTGGWMPIVAAFALVGVVGIQIAGPTFAETSDEAITVANQIEYPVVLKAASAELLHKSDHRGVHLNLHTDFDVACAFEIVEKAHGPQFGGVIVQSMCAPGVELIAAISNHPTLGPVVMIGEGGRLADLRDDTALGRPPITPMQARRQVQALRIEQLLSGFRGSDPISEDSVVNVILRLSELAQLAPEIVALEINPLIASSGGICAADVKIRLAPVNLPRTETFRQLR